MADVDVPQAGQRVEVALAVGVDDLGAFAAHDHERSGVVGRMRKRMDQVLSVGLEQAGQVAPKSLVRR